MTHDVKEQAYAAMKEKMPLPERTERFRNADKAALLLGNQNQVSTATAFRSIRQKVASGHQ